MRLLKAFALVASIVAVGADASSAGGGGVGPKTPVYQLATGIHPTAIAAAPGGHYVCVRSHLARLNRRGVLTAIPIQGPCGDLAVEASGSVLVTQADRVLRVGDTATTTVATGVAPLGVAAEPDGSVLIAEAADVRRVSPAGEVSTVAGTGEEGEPIEGALATASPIEPPVAIAALADGAFVLADGGGDTTLARVVRVGTDGRITTLMKLRERLIKDMSADPAGEVFVVTDGGAVRRLTANGHTVALGRARQPSEIYGGPDFNAVTQISADAEGGVVGVTESGLSWLPAAATRHLAVALQPFRGRVAGTRYRAAIRTTVAPTSVTTELKRAGHTVARAHGLAVKAGSRHGVYTVAVTVRRGSEVARDSIRVFLGGVLPTRLARAYMDDELGFSKAADDTDNSKHKLGPCRRFSPRRYDCAEQTTDETGAPPYSCNVGATVGLLDSGLVVARMYDCPAPRLHPRGLEGPDFEGPDPPLDPDPVIAALTVPTPPRTPPAPSARPSP